MWYGCDGGNRCESPGTVVFVKTCSHQQTAHGDQGCFYAGNCCAGSFSCEVEIGDDPQCNSSMRDCDFEVCGNTLDDDCDGDVDESPCADDQACNNRNDAYPTGANSDQDRFGTAAQCMGGCKGDGKPVSLALRQASIGPHEAARISSDLGGSADLVFDVLWDSRRSTRDYANSTGYLRPLGPGFRHRYADRLILEPATASLPGKVIWESLDANVQFFPVTTGSATFKSEPGTNHRLQRSGTSPNYTWRLHTDGGDVLEFVERAGSTEYTPGHHVRLKRLYPGGAAQRKIVLAYEDEPTGSGVEDVPAGACTNLVTGAPAGQTDCYAPRGLLVKVGVVLDGTVPGPSFELTYTERASPVAHGRIGLDLVRSGGDRVDGAAISTFAQATWLATAGLQPRLAGLRTRLYCTSTNGSCDIARYAWSSTFPSKITDVDRPGVSTSGTLTTLQDEDFTWELVNGRELVLEHRSLGVELVALTPDQSPAGPASLYTMTWRRNSASVTEDFTFDYNGDLIQCSSGACGDPDMTRTYRHHWPFDHYTLGPSKVTGKDGFITFRQFNDAGKLEFLCEAAFSTAGGENCYLDGGGRAGVSSATAHVRHLERRYYDAHGRLWARAVYDPETTLTNAMRFPVSTTDTVVNWFASAPLSTTSCPTLTTEANIGGTVHRWHVTVYDADSDGDGTVNEQGTWDYASRPDALVVRTNTAAATEAAGASSTCTISARNARGDVTEVRRLFNGLHRGATTLSYFGATSTVRGNGRLEKVTRYTGLGSTPTGPIVTQDACTASSYDDEGRLTCYEVPQAFSLSTAVTETTSAGDGVVAFSRALRVAGDGAVVGTFTKHLAWGPVYERAVGGSDPGNATRVTFKGGSATRALAVGQVKEVDGAGGQVARTLYEYDSYGRQTLTSSYDASNVLRRRTQRGPDDEDRTAWLQPGGAGYPAIEYDYRPSGAIAQVHEADGTYVDYVEGNSVVPGPGTGRTYEVHRGGWVMQRFGYTRDGLIADMGAPAMGSSVQVGVYRYDALRRMVSDERKQAGQTVTTGWWDDARVDFRRVDTTNSSSVEILSYGYDGLGRPTLIQNVMNGVFVRAHRWDDKGSFEGISVPGRTTKLTNNFTTGRLGYVEDEEGATFYEYDGAGRIVAVIRHDGPLSSFNAYNLRAFDFAYDASTGQLTSITYPSGRVVSYGYGNDRARPTSVTTGAHGTVLTNATYDVDGALASFRWLGSSSRARTVTRDLIGRVTAISDNASIPGDAISYAYDGDGDLVSETATAGRSWLSTAKNQTFPLSRNYTEQADMDVLASWVDGGAPESVTYSSSLRRATETAGGTTHTYTWDPTYRERLLSKLAPNVDTIHEVILTYDTAGRVTTIDWAPFPSVDVGLTYGAFGQLTAYTATSSGAYDYAYDHELRLVKQRFPSGTVRRVRYAGGRDPLVDERGTSETWEHIYLGGEPVGQVAVNGAASALRLLITDRMGRVRKISTSAGTPLVRYTWDAWGDSNGAFSATDATETPQPEYSWTLPGQRRAGFGITLNGWRALMPEVGQYTSPEPMHAAAALVRHGPRSYSYAGANPLTRIDADARIDLKIGEYLDEAIGEATIHANPGTSEGNAGGFLDSAAQGDHRDLHFHFDGRDGPRIKVERGWDKGPLEPLDEFVPYSDEDACKMTRKQRKLLKELNKPKNFRIRRLIQWRVTEVFTTGKFTPLPGMAATATTLGAKCMEDPEWCIQAFGDL